MSFIIYYQSSRRYIPRQHKSTKGTNPLPLVIPLHRAPPPHPSFLPRTDTWVERSPSLKHNTLLENDFFT